MTTPHDHARGLALDAERPSGRVTAGLFRPKLCRAGFLQGRPYDDGPADIALHGYFDWPRELRLTALFNAGMATLHIGPRGPNACRVRRTGRANEDVGAVDPVLLDEMLHGRLSIATGVEVGNDGSLHETLP
jgi:hypothetical protein